MRRNMWRARDNWSVTVNRDSHWACVAYSSISIDPIRDWVFLNVCLCAFACCLLGDNNKKALWSHSHLAPIPHINSDLYVRDSFAEEGTHDTSKNTQTENGTLAQTHTHTHHAAVFILDHKFINLNTFIFIGKCFRNTRDQCRIRTSSFFNTLYFVCVCMFRCFVAPMINEIYKWSAYKVARELVSVYILCCRVKILTPEHLWMCDVDNEIKLKIILYCALGAR